MKKLFKFCIVTGLVIFALDRAAGVLLYYLDPEFRRMLDGKKSGANDTSKTREDIRAILTHENGTIQKRRIEYDTE